MDRDPSAPAPPQLSALVRDLQALEAIFAGWESEQQGAVAAYRATLEDLHREAMRRLIASLRREPQALALMKEALADELVYGVLRHLGLVKASLQERVEAALASVRPLLATHGGDVELAHVKPPDTVGVRFLGSCDGCPASQLTFVAGVKKAIQEACPEVVTIEEVRGLAAGNGKDRVQFVSPFARGLEDGWLPAATLGQVPEGRLLRREVGGRDLILSRNGGVVSCFSNACAHLGQPLHAGLVDDGVVTCPHHGFAYLLESGECLTAPKVQLETHAVRVVEDRVEVRLSC
jgi:Fe-S cluster biogenesis protein NfuA/nitrite reductase/ring-hydroxylating ferredoxin subunit